MDENQLESNRRTIIAIGIMLVMSMLYMTYFAPKPPEEPADAGAAVAQPVVPGPAVVPDAGVAAAPLAPMLPPDEEIPQVGTDVVTENTKYGFSNEGAGLVQAELLGPKMREQQQLTLAQGFKRLLGGKVPEPPQMDMATPVPALPLPLSVSISGPRPFAANARYRMEEDAAAKTLTFTARSGQTEIVKVVQVGESGFEGVMRVTVRNLGAEPLAGQFQVHYVRGVVPGSEEKASFFGGVGNESFASCHVGDAVHRLAPGEEEKPQVEQGDVGFFGINQQYFLGMLWPLEGAKAGKCTLLATPSARSATAELPLEVAPGQQATFDYGLYVGPKDTEMLRGVPARLKSLGVAEAAMQAGGWAEGFQETRYPQLEKTIDYGWWAAICKVLLFFMQWFFRAFHNWGVAIILLTVLVKLILLPLTHKSMVAAENMKKLQPRIEELRKKFAEDKNRQNLEMMKLYQEAKVNPLGGCLPLLLQMPVWIALFTTLRNSYDIYREPFIAPIWMDLTYKDPTYILPIALGVTMIITQKLQPQMMDAMQARMMTYFMPIFFTAIMLNYPAGLSLYIFTNNVLSIGQQYGLRKYLEKKGLAAPRPAGTGGRTKRT